MNEDPTVLKKIDICLDCLDKLVDARGRAKCGYIYVIGEYLNNIRDHILIVEEKLKDMIKEKESNQNGIET